MTSNEQVVNDFIDAWRRLDLAAMKSLFTEDCVYHNMPWPVVKGRAEVLDLIAGFFKNLNMTGADFKVTHQLSSGNLVMNERVDHLTVNGKTVLLPVAGIFELEGGKIKAWRDYFDAATFDKAVAA